MRNPVRLDVRGGMRRARCVLAGGMSVLIAAGALACAPAKPPEPRPEPPKRREVVLDSSVGEVDKGREAAQAVEREMGLVKDPAMVEYVRARQSMSKFQQVLKLAIAFRWQVVEKSEQVVDRQETSTLK